MNVQEQLAPGKTIERLQREISVHEDIAIAISGGVDSTTLATVAHNVLGKHATMLHAVSPAVPPEASDRVRFYAAQFGWQLKIINAGEFDDSQYRANPVNRCFYCKSNLYTEIRQQWTGVVASGANLDDLGDYRPGLLAAREHHVIHPLINAGINKAGVRAMASELGLDRVAELPAQPCLSSRVETGIAISADDLMFVHRIERYLSEKLGAGDIRCRLSHDGVRIEIPAALMGTNASEWPAISCVVERMIADDGRTFAGYANYVRGSAFLHGA